VVSCMYVQYFSTMSGAFTGNSVQMLECLFCECALLTFPKNSCHEYFIKCSLESIPVVHYCTVSDGDLKEKGCTCSSHLDGYESVKCRLWRGYLSVPLRQKPGSWRCVLWLARPQSFLFSS
jgi:hypothetical protein